MTSTEIANASKIMIGTTEAIKMYIGSTLLYVKQSSTQNKVWVSLTDQSITSSTPIYKIGVTNISQNQTVCRVGFTKEAGLTNVSDPAEYPSRLWYSGDSQNKVSIHWKHGNSIYNQPQNWYPQGNNKGWFPYSDIHVKQTITLKDNTTINNVWVYDCLNGTYTDEDDEGNNPLYFYYSQTNSPLSNFYVMIDDDDYSNYYFTIESLQDSNQIKMQKNGSGINPTLSYSLDDGETWTTTTISGNTVFATINTGDKIIFKGNNTAFATAWDKYYYFTASKQFNVYGNIMSIINGDNFKENSEFDSSSTHQFAGLFRTTYLVDASNLILPALTLYVSSYNGMFRGASNLVYGPKTLPALNIPMDGYSSMFEGCVKLVEGPEILATSVSGCTALNRMFCMSRNSKVTAAMTKSPILRITNPQAQNNTYQQLFCGNGNINEITILAQGTNLSFANWLSNANSSGVIKTLSDTTFVSGVNGLPSGWSTETYTQS